MDTGDKITKKTRLRITNDFQKDSRLQPGTWTAWCEDTGHHTNEAISQDTQLVVLYLNSSWQLVYNNVSDKPRAMIYFQNAEVHK